MTGMVPLHNIKGTFQANFGSLRCIQVIAGVLGRAGEAGQKQRLAAAERGEITYRPAKNLHMPEEQEAAEKTPLEVQQQIAKNLEEDESLEDADEMGEKLDEAKNRERSGRSIKKID